MDKGFEKRGKIKLEAEEKEHIKSEIGKISELALQGKEDELSEAISEFDAYIHGIIDEKRTSNPKSAKGTISKMVDMQIKSVKTFQQKGWPEFVMQKTLDASTNILASAIRRVIEGDYDYESEIEKLRPKMK